MTPAQEAEMARIIVEACDNAPQLTEDQLRRLRRTLGSIRPRPRVTRGAA